MLFFGHIGLAILIVFLIVLALKIGIDYRLVIVGSMLPDIIDKPLGEYILKDIFYNGRILSHTVLFLVVLAMIALIVAKKYQYWGVGVLAFGAAVHQLLDQMWNAPETWFWPLFGWGFPRNQIDNYIMYLLGNLLKYPEVYLPELIGAIVIVAFIARYRLYRPENAKVFILTGKLSIVSQLKPLAIEK